MKLGLEALLEPTPPAYDSTADTMEHIAAVQARLQQVVDLFIERGRVHDQSKLEDPEKTVFDEMTPLLKDSEYGSDEYKGFLKKMKPALDHHYANNSHHPEFHENGIEGMSLFDLIEMLCDWKAATTRHKTGDIMKSLEINKDRFNMNPYIYGLLKGAILELGWDKP